MPAASAGGISKKGREMARGIYGSWTTLDLESEGKRFGVLNVPMSTTRSAYGNLQVPLAVIAKGSGPTVLLMAGNHGDEYEGQVSLSRVVRELQPDDLNGRVIVMPAANLPAVLDAARVSPVDGGNLNSSFPGRVDGGPTAQIAHFVESELLPKCVAWLDLHSGGSSLEYLPMAAIHQSEDAALDKRALEALAAFGAPTSVVFRFQHEYAASSAAQRRDVVYIYGEFGGGGTVNPVGVRITYEGVLRALAHFKILRDLGRFKVGPAQRSNRLFDTSVGDTYVATRRNYAFAPVRGVFECFVPLGEWVEAGQPMGCVHHVEEPGREPSVVSFPMAGMLLAKRHAARVEGGDCLGQLALPRAG